MAPQLAPKVKEKTAAKWQEKLAPFLYPGEVVWALARLNGIKPMLEGLAVTNARLLAFAMLDLDSNGPKLRIDADDIATFRIEKKLGGPVLSVTRHNQDVVKFATVLGSDEDAKFVAFFVDYLAKSGFPIEVRQSVAEAIAASPAGAPRTGWLNNLHQHEKSTKRHEIPVIGAPLKDVHWRTLDDHSGADEIPWFIISCGGAGILAAYEDRLIVAKVGINASMMAGSLGGGRITTFHYTEITNIEYNSGLVTGVLEILTPSYHGGQNHDYWQSAFKNPNKVDNNPWALSNTLPLPKMQYQAALPYLNNLQSKIAAAKRPTIAGTQPSPPPPSLANELKDLSALHAQGVLSDGEFTAAKQAAIERSHRR